MKLLVFLVPVLIFRTCLWSQASAIVFEDAGPDWAEIYLKIPTTEFSDKHIAEIATQHLLAGRSKKLIKIVIATDSDDLLHMRKGKAMADYSYDLWADVAAEAWHRRAPLATVISLGGSTALTIRDVEGRTREVMLRGRSPLAITNPMWTFQILHVGFAVVPFANARKVHVLLFVKTDRQISAETAQGYARVLRESVDLEEKTLAIFRQDSWFLENEGFPVFYPFGQELNPPTLQEYLCTPTVICELEGDNCRTQDYGWGKCQNDAR